MSPEQLDRAELEGREFHEAAALRLMDLDRDQLANLVLSRFCADELDALAARRRDAEERHEWAALGQVAERFWSKVETDPDTAAALERIASEWSSTKVSRHFGPRDDTIRHSSRYGAAALESELSHLAGAEPGGRNQALNLAAFRLGRLVGGGHLDAGEVISALADAGRSLGLSEWEIRSTVMSGFDAGHGRPR
jgi:hypothetical protein